MTTTEANKAFITKMLSEKKRLEDRIMYIAEQFTKQVRVHICDTNAAF